MGMYRYRGYKCMGMYSIEGTSAWVCVYRVQVHGYV